MPAEKPTTIKRPGGGVVEYKTTKDAKGHVTTDRIVKRKDGRIVGKDV